MYGSDDEEGQMEVMLKKKGTLDGFGLEEDAANGSGEEEGPTSRIWRIPRMSAS